MTFSALSATASFTELSIFPVGITPDDSRLKEGIGNSPIPNSGTATGCVELALGLLPAIDGVGCVEPALGLLPPRDGFDEDLEFGIFSLSDG